MRSPSSCCQAPSSRGPGMGPVPLSGALAAPLQPGCACSQGSHSGRCLLLWDRSHLGPPLCSPGRGLSRAGADLLLTNLVTFILSTGTSQLGPADATSSRKPPALNGHRTRHAF